MARPVTQRLNMEVSPLNVVQGHVIKEPVKSVVIKDLQEQKMHLVLVVVLAVVLVILQPVNVDEHET